jgi:hypothetical protein
MTGPTRAEIEALLDSIQPDNPWPPWARQPADEAEFAAAILARTGAEPVYEDGILVAFKGIGLKGGTP